MTQRSTKGASKQRRDAINDKISQIRELLPVSEAVRTRMSQLQVMALTNAFITKSNFFSDYCFDVDDRSTMLAEHFDFTQTMPGFLLMANVDGRILYISDNVSEYLGNSSVDSVTQLESVYDLIDERDREMFRQAMAQHQKSSSSSSSSAADGEPWMQVVHGSVNGQTDCADDELSFTCRMNSTARSVRTVAAQSTLRTGFERQKTMQVTGRFLRPRSLCFGGRSSYSNPHLMTVFVAHCCPHLTVGSSPIVSCIDVTETSEADTMTFRSVHQLDMRFIKIDANGEFHLSCDRRNIFGKSWYAMIHPEDIDEAKKKHMELASAHQIGDMTASRAMCIRVQTATGCSLWLHMVMRLHGSSNQDASTFNDFSGRQAVIMCTSHVIDEMSALYLRLQELETPTETASSENPQPVVCGQNEDVFCGLPLSFLDSTPVHQPLSIRTQSQREDDRMELNQRLKRKISDRRLEQADAVQRSKVPRLDDVPMTDAVESWTATCMPPYSMPSPPMQPWDNHANQLTGSVGQTTFSYSTFGDSAMPDGNLAATMFNFQAGGTTSTDNVVSLPDCYVTPSNSPALEENTWTDDVHFGLDDFIKRLPDGCYEQSFFGSSQQIQGVVQQKASIPVGVANNGWNNSLPELDPRTIAVILGDSELPTPTAAGPSMSEFVLKTGPCRQQLSGGHVIVFNGADQQVGFGRNGSLSAAANQQQQLRVMATPAVQETVSTGANHVAEQLVDDQLLRSLLAIGGDFMQNVADMYLPTTISQFE